MHFGLEPKTARGCCRAAEPAASVEWLAVMTVHRSGRVAITAQVLVKRDLARVEKSAGFEMRSQMHPS